MDVKINILNERVKIPIELIEACGEMSLLQGYFITEDIKILIPLK